MSKTDKVQIIKDEKGDAAFAVLPVTAYEALSKAAQDLEDIRRGDRASLEESAGEHLVPAEVVHRIASGESPVRVWREYRGLKGIELARLAGISAPYLSEIETGKKDGTFRTMAAIADCLDVDLNDLVPIPDNEEREQRARALRIAALQAQIGQIESLIMGANAFDTAAVRDAAAALAVHARRLLEDGYNPDGWLDDVLRSVEEISALIGRAEGDIIETAQTTRSDLEQVVSEGGLRRRPQRRARSATNGDAARLAGHFGPRGPEAAD